MSEKQKNVLGFIVMMAVLGAMPFLARAWEVEEERMNQEKYEEVVQETVQLIQEGSYEEALDKLEEVPESTEDEVTENLGRYAKMLQDEKENFFIGTLNSEANAIVVKYSGDLKEKMKQDVERIHTAYQKYKEQREEEERLAEEEAARKALEEKKQSQNTYYSGSSSYSKPSKSYTYNDPYDARDYDDPEDFYYDNEDLFDDYEDAEDEWEDAWDE